MLEFIVIFVGLLLFVALMAVGVMFKRKPISGSCGGLGGVGIEKACDCDKPCDKRLAREAAARKEAKVEFK